MTRSLSVLLAAVGAALALLPRPAPAADLAIMPVAVALDAARDRATVRVLNQGREPVLLQADAIAWLREGGVDRDAPTDALIVNPPLFTVAPGQAQVVRVGLRHGAAGDAERTYRLVLREVPPLETTGRAGVSGSVRVLVALRVPVYVAPREALRQGRWQLQRDADGGVSAELTNAGNVHLKVGLLRLLDAGRGVIAEQAAGALLFPGEARRFRLRPPGAAASGPLTLEVTGDEGAHDVALDDPAR